MRVQAATCIEAKPDWGKGYGRKGAALHGLGRFDQAIAAYEKGLDVEPGLAMLTRGAMPACCYARALRPRWIWTANHGIDARYRPGGRQT